MARRFSGQWVLHAARSAPARAARWARMSLVAVAALVVLWSFFRVGSRPLRHHEQLGSRVEVTVLHWGEREEDRITQSLVDSFESTHPHIKIKRINAAADYFAKLQTMVAAGDPPDVFFLNAWTLPSYASQGVLRDIEPFIKRDIKAGRLPFRFDDMYPQALDAFRYDGKHLGKGPLYGLPMSFTPMGFYYNKTLFDKAGVPYPADDWTWEDFEDAAGRLSKLPGVTGAAFDLRGSGSIRLMLWTYGTDLVNDDFTKIRTDDPRVRQVMQRVRDWGAHPGRIRLFGDARNEVETGAGLFMAGRAAMYGPVGRWMVPDFRKIDTFDWDFAQLPRGTERKNMLYVAAWCVAAGSKHPELAWEVARHFATPEAQRINSGLGLALPTLKSVAESSAFTNPDLPPEHDKLYLKAVTHSRPMPWAARTRLNSFLTNAIDASVRMRTEPVDKALKGLQADFNRVNNSPLASESFPSTPWRDIVIGIALPVVLLVVLLVWLWLRGRPGKLARAQENAGLLMVSPWIIGFTAFIAAPMVLSLLLAFMKWSGLATLDHAQWVGLGNVRELLFNDGRFTRSVWVTAYFALLAVPLGQVVALGTAMLMNNPIKLINVFRSLWYLPTVLAGVAMAVMWWWVFDSDFGLLNAALHPLTDAASWAVHAVFGAPPASWGKVWFRPPEWFERDAAWAGVPAFAIASLWTVGGTMLIYLAGLANIPRDLYEAAQLDGAGWLGRFRNVTLPMLSPVILFNVVIAIISSFQVFTQAYIMTGGGPNDATLFYVLYLYSEAFQVHEMGYASAMAWILFVIVLILTLVVMRMSRKRVHYEGIAA